MHPGNGVEPADDGRGESPTQRADRNFAELLQELRVAQTGTQILFAFLLATAFTQLLQDSDAFTQRLLALDLVLAAVATATLIAPVALHRALFRRRMKAQLVQTASRLARVGLGLLMAAVTGSCLLALDAVLPRAVAAGVSAAVLAVFLALWVVLPVVVARSHRRRSGL